MAGYYQAPTASIALVLRTSNIPLPYGATISTVPLSAAQLDNNFISNQNIFIPQPQIHINGGALASSHYNTQPIENDSYLKQSFTEGISLYWNGSDKTFLDYDPHFFLFRHSNKGTNHRYNGHGRADGPKKHCGFVHPANESGHMFTNFSAGSSDQYWGNTEWAIGETKAGQLVDLVLESDNYYTINNHATGYLKNNYFPRTITSWNREVYLRGNKGKKLTIKAKKVVLSFAIVIRDPKNPARYIIGPMSKTLIITPKIGVFQIPGDYINVDNTLSIPNSPNWSLCDTTKHIFYGWKAYTK